jgi:alkylation response protein AidB-like acyl-CoA dehydrogenase
LDVGEHQIVAAKAGASDLIERLQHRAIAYIAAETSGLIAMLLDATVEHLKTRQQFGQPLSRFQALQHRAVEMLVSLEQVRSMAIYAAASLDEPDAQERRKAFAAVKAVVSNAARFCGQQAVQLHGGVGLTEEHRVGWGLRRLTMIDLAFGDADANAAKLAELGGFTAPA